MLMHKRKADLCLFSLQDGLDKSMIVVYVDKVKYLDFIIIIFFSFHW